MSTATIANPWRIVHWTDGHNRNVKKMICHESELDAVLNLPFPPGAVAREPVYEFTGVDYRGAKFFRRMPWIKRGYCFIENINQGDRECQVAAVDEDTGDYLYVYSMPAGREFMRKGPGGNPVTRSRLPRKWKLLLGDIDEDSEGGAA